MYYSYTTKRNQNTPFFTCYGFSLHIHVCHWWQNSVIAWLCWYVSTNVIFHAAGQDKICPHNPFVTNISISSSTILLNFIHTCTQHKSFFTMKSCAKFFFFFYIGHSILISTSVWGIWILLTTTNYWSHCNVTIFLASHFHCEQTMVIRTITADITNV